MKDINSNPNSAVQIYGELGKWFKINRGSRKRENISPVMFVSDLERAMSKIKEYAKGRVYD